MLLSQNKHRCILFLVVSQSSWQNVDTNLSLDPEATMSIENTFGGKVFSGSANQPLARGIANYLGCKLGEVEFKVFDDGEQFLQYKESIRGDDVYIVQPTCPPSVDKHYIQLLLMIQAAKLASARRITAVMPYHGYQRQDRKNLPRVPVSAGLMADALKAAFGSGVERRVLFMDLHAAQLENAYHSWCQVDHLTARPALVDYYAKTLKLDPKNLVVVAPDFGRGKFAEAFAEKLSDRDPLSINKKRDALGDVEARQLRGDLEGRDVLLVDDILGTASTLAKAAARVAECGARDIYACAVHGLFLKDAVGTILASPIKEVCVTDTVPISPYHLIRARGRINVVSVATLIAEAIRRTHLDESVSSLFD